MYLKKVRIVASLTALCLGMAVLAGCGQKEEAQNSSETPETTNDETAALSAEAADQASEFETYTVEGVGTFYLPEGFSIESGKYEEPLPTNYAVLTKDSVVITANRFGTDAYEAAGVSLPVDLEEYSQRDGVKKGVPEGTEFTWDSYGNLCTEYTGDGDVVYYALKKGTDSYGFIAIVYPEGEETDAVTDAAKWASLFILE